MASRKVAPTLRRVVEDIANVLRPESKDSARAELRAMLAVARAADRGYRHGFRDDPKWVVPLVNALARLSRAGRAKGAR